MGKCDEANVEVNMGDSASPMKPDNFTFTVPPEAPVFEPTPEEFLDPLAYINKIRPIAEKSGICKIKPPENWQPPFAVDVDRLRFTPRIQRLNELEAITRLKLNFLDQIIKFWELQGSTLKIPTLEKKPLDLYTLHKIVKEAGGFESCSAERKWSKIARRMGFPQGKGVGSILKNHYERILFPYDLFKSSGVVTDHGSTKLEMKHEQTPERVVPSTRSKSTSKASPGSPSRRFKAEPEQEGSRTEGALPDAPEKGISPQKTPIKGQIKEEATEARRSPRENKWMSTGSCGSRVTRSRLLREHRINNMSVCVTPAPEQDAVTALDDPLAKYMCRVCGRGDCESQMLLCDGCDDSYHTFCLVPPLADVPKGDWRCPVCIAEEVSKPTEAFGFEQASREYTLQQFGEMADQFKSDYFNMPVHMVPLPTVEREFWRVVSSIDEDVTVEYGADLHSMDHGSGFPTKSSAHLYPGEQQYAESSWNLNNLPVLEGSVLRHIDADISGMKVPWVYVGMCFATFCWHNEDHWSYSINYLHWGEAKTWYGVPGCKAELFESAMKAEAPELFHLQPDLLHQLVTIMNPNILMKAGVPVYRTDQHAGEFVITFPRAYHAGFNQGYNFAEAVNFTPADWLRMGRECISHYSLLRRCCVFSHDELLCKLALSADQLTLSEALAAYKDMRIMLHDERRLRKELLDWGVSEAEREVFECVSDDCRQCIVCHTTCFLSSVRCKRCQANALVCLRHHKELCQHEPNEHVLRYRYTLDELPGLVSALKVRAESFKRWASSVRRALRPQAKVHDLDGLRQLLTTAEQLNVEKGELVIALETAILDAEKCASVIQQLDLNKMRTRTRHQDPKYRLTLEELTLFAEEIDGLACVLPEGSAVKEVLRQTEEFTKKSQKILEEDLEDISDKIRRELEETVEVGSQLCIVLEQLPALQTRLSQVKYLQAVKGAKDEPSSLTLQLIDKLLEDSEKVVPHVKIEAERAFLSKLKAEVLDWEKEVQSLLSGGGTHVRLSEAKTLADAGEHLPAEPPSLNTLNQAILNADEWLQAVEEMQSKDLYPYYHSLEALVKKGQTIPLPLYEKDQLKNALISAQEWKKGAADMFLKKKSSLSLLEALSPLRGVGLIRRFKEGSSPGEVVAAFKQAEARELLDITQLRDKNIRKDIFSGCKMDLNQAPLFCYCQKRQYGIMTQCELCKDWFHASCIESSEKKSTSDSSGESENEDRVRPSLTKFLCQQCVRSKRPRLEKILGLLMWLSRLSVRVPEGEALQCECERAMAWQDKAREILAEAPHMNIDKSNKSYTDMRKNSKSMDSQASQNARMMAREEHAYSASPQRRNLHSSLEEMEELMMEGDLLEVSVAEQKLVWMAVCSLRGANDASNRFDAGRKRRQRMMQHPSKRGRNQNRDGPTKSANSSPARRGGSSTNYLNRKQNLPGTSLMMRKHYLSRQQRRKTNPIRGKKTRIRGNGGRTAIPRPVPSASSSSSSDDDEDCSAPKCLKPIGKEVDWVQCDGGCELWFHMFCVGLRKDALRDDDDYVCGACAAKKNTH